MVCHRVLKCPIVVATDRQESKSYDAAIEWEKRDVPDAAAADDIQQKIQIMALEGDRNDSRSHNVHPIEVSDREGKFNNELEKLYLWGQNLLQHENKAIQ